MCRGFWDDGATSQPNYPLTSCTDAQLSTGPGPSPIRPARPASRLSPDWLQIFIAQVGVLFAPFRAAHAPFVAVNLILFL